MPIDAPDLDDLTYRDIVERAKQLIPVYCPEWTNFNDADPGMTLVQLFAWMTEMTIYRLNRVPEATYIHFLNFIGERQGVALPARALVSFRKINDKTGPVRVPRLTEVATEQTEETDEIRFLTCRDLTVVAPKLDRVIGLRVHGERDTEREVLAIERIFPLSDEAPLVYELGGKAGDDAGLPLLEPDPDRDNLNANVYDQFLYLGHALLERLHTDAEVTLHIELKGNESGKLFDLQRFFRWEHRNDKGEWVPWEDSRKLLAEGIEPQPPVAAWPERDRELVTDRGRHVSRFWVRGALDFETYFLELIREHPKGRFKPRRGASRQMELMVDLRGSAFEFKFLEPVRPGAKEAFILRFPRLSLNVNATYVPGFQWYYGTEDGRWALLPERNVRVRGLDTYIEGPMPADSVMPCRFQARRIRAVDLAALTDEGELVVSLERQIQLQLMKGADINRLEDTSLESAPIEPFSASDFNVKPAENGALYIGSDVLEDTVERVLVEFGYYFKNWKYPRAGDTGLEDDLRRYRFRLEYRDKHKWKAVKLAADDGSEFEDFCFADMQPSYSQEDQFFTVRMMLEPPRQMKGIAAVELHGHSTYWIRLVLCNVDLTDQEEVNVGQTQTGKVDKDGEKTAAKEQSNIFIKRDLHYFPQIFDIKLQHRGAGKRRKPEEGGPEWYRHVLHEFEAVGVNENRENPRFTSVRPLVSRASRKETSFPWIAPVDTTKSGRWIYLALDRPIPPDEEMSIYFKMTAEPVRGAERTARWEYLEGDRWRELRFLQTAFDFRGSGFLRLAIPKLGLSSLDGVRWLRCKVPDEVRRADGTFGPARYPRVTHVLLNACEVANLQRRELEKFSAFGVPNQRVQLLFQPVVVLDRDVQNALPEDLHGETFIDVGLEEGEDVKSWTWSADDDLRDAERNSEVYAVDPVRGIVRFGDGVHGLIPKAGTHNVVVKHYFTTDGLAGNVPQGTIAVCPPFASQLVVDNPFPAVGGRNVEDVDDLVRRAPRALTGRARAVTTEDFELIAREASGTLARCHAYKDPADDPWVVRLVVLPQRDPKTHDIPDAEEIGLLAAVRDYVQHRCLINTVTKVEMTDLVPITVELTCRLQPRTNPSGVRERAEAWVTGFLDPYTGGVDAAGWPFGELPRAQDLQHIIKEIPEIRHVEQCQVLRAVREGEALSVTRHLDPRAVRPRQLFVLAATPSIVVEEG